MKKNKRFIHYLLCALSLVAAVACGILIPRVNVNADMTKYLPDDSPMKQGLDIINTEFNAAQLQSADVKVMIPDVDDEERLTLAKALGEIEQVQDVTYELSADSAYTLYNLVVPKSVDQKKLGAGIREHYGDDIVVETSQDGATPPLFVMIIAAVLIFLVLFGMAQSWLDPVIIMISAGIAVVLNIGTNALLPSVSITTNYIVAILQLVLSLDYSIILMNRYRQEWAENVSKYQSVNLAIKGSVRPILSSALTTIVGLLMLLFMRLKIGTDMGVVLAKGVVCSLICTFTVMPTLLLCFQKGMIKTAKKTFLIPTDRLGRFATHHKISLAIFFVALFVVAYIFSRKTEISFSTNGESQIAKVFPKINPTLIIYDKADEHAIIPLADSLATLSGVDNIISYPTLLQQQYTAEGLTAYIQDLTTTMADYLPQVDGLEMLTPELMRVVYLTRSGAPDTMHIGFRDLMMCIRYDCMENPLFASVIDDNMKAQIVLLDQLMAPTTDEEGHEWIEAAVPSQRGIKVKPISPVTINPALSNSSTPTVVQIETSNEEVTSSAPIIAKGDHTIPLRAFLIKLHQVQGSALTAELVRITDPVSLNKEMNIRQMADFIGSTHAQTKMVFSMAEEGKRMTPIQYVHFLADDLFQRRTLANMVQRDQKEQLIVRKNLMDLALTDPQLTSEEMASVLKPFGWTMTAAQVEEIAYNTTSTPSTINDVVEQLDQMVQTASLSTSTTTVRKPRKTKAERQAELMDKLLTSTKTYTAAEMQKNFTRLGQSIDYFSVKMLYAYYGSRYAYNDSLTMSAEQMIHYVADTLIQDSAMNQYLDNEYRQQIQSLPTLVSQNIGMLSNEHHGLLVVLSSLPDESPETYQYIDSLNNYAREQLSHPFYMMGESVMFSEMKNGFSDEMTRITWLTILAIFLIVAFSFRSLVVPIILVMTVMTAVFVNVIFSGLISGHMLYLAYLIVQSILMGASIDYGILFTNCYKECRQTMDQYKAATEAYHGSIRTITTSGLIMVLGPGVMALCIDDVAISAIVGCLSIGALVSILLILVILPGVLIAFDRWVVQNAKKTSKNLRNSK